jgi:hypothetical protein
MPHTDTHGRAVPVAAGVLAGVLTFVAMAEGPWTSHAPVAPTPGPVATPTTERPGPTPDAVP